jgi:hypothetical protein
MLALRVMDSLNTAKEVALAEPDFIWADTVVTDSINWAEVFSTTPSDSSPVSVVSS